MGHQHVGFDRWAERYDHGIQGRVSRWFYQAVLTTDIPAGSRVLDVGCGTGRLLSLMTEREAVGAGVDVSPQMVAVARRANPQMDIRQGVADDLPFDDNTFDLVVTCLAYHHLGTPERFLAEADRVLVPGGRLVVAEPRLGVLRWPLNAWFRAHDHVERFVSAADIRADLARAKFTPVRTRVRGLTVLEEVRRP